MVKNVSAGVLSKDELAEARKLDDKLCEGIGRKDLDAVMACFWNSPDLVAVIAGEVQKGFDAVRNGMRELFDRNELVRLEVNDVTYLRSGDAIIGVGTATFDLTPVDGSRQLMVERWSDLRRKIDGRLVYVLDHTTMVPK
jgi:ketosteroid isomerase-like protein